MILSNLFYVYFLQTPYILSFRQLPRMHAVVSFDSIYNIRKSNPPFNFQPIFQLPPIHRPHLIIINQNVTFRPVWSPKP